MENLRVKLSKMSLQEKADLFEELVIHCLNAGFRFEIERDGIKKCLGAPEQSYVIYVDEESSIEEEIIHLEWALRNRDHLLSSIISTTERIYHDRDTHDYPDAVYERLRQKLHDLALLGWRKRSTRNYLLKTPDDNQEDERKGRQ